MNKNNLPKAEEIRDFFRSFLKTYFLAAEKAKIPVDKERLQSIIDNAEFKVFEKPNCTGTFSVNRKLIQVIINNFRNNGLDRNIFLLLHECAHLDSSVNEELFANQNALLQQLEEKTEKLQGEYKTALNVYYAVKVLGQLIGEELNDALKQQLEEKAEKIQGKYITALNAYYGIIAIDEVLAQWTSEELNDALKNRKREVHTYTRGPLDSDIKFKSDFSDNDIYSPLQPVVENLLQSLGYKDIREFASNVLASNKGVVNSIQGKNFDKLCMIGVICKAIYKENGFTNPGNVSKEEVEKAYSILLPNFDFGENNGGVGHELDEER